MMRRLILMAVVSGLVTLYPAAPHTVGATGSVNFHVVVSGKAHDMGTITSSIGDVADDFNGCALIKQKAAAAVLGAQTLEIHVNYAGGHNLMAGGVQPYVAREVYMQIDNYRPSVGTYTRGPSGANGDLSFVVNGHVYAAAERIIAHIRNGGRDGTISGQDAQRFYPGKAYHLLHGVSYQASWHCSRMFQKTAPSL